METKMSDVREKALLRLGAELGALSTELRAVAVEAASAFDPPITVSAFHLLQWISTHGSARASQVAEGLAIDRSVVSRLVRQLLDDGLVTVRGAEGDGRSVVSELTDLARAQLAKATARKGQYFLQRTTQFTDGELEQLATLLHRLNSGSEASGHDH